MPERVDGGRCDSRRCFSLIRDYGAIEVGAHRFCHVENGRNDCGVFRFVHVWQKQPGGWKITRAVSYDH